jgi:hypothetical protein
LKIFTTGAYKRKKKYAQNSFGEVVMGFYDISSFYLRALKIGGSIHHDFYKVQSGIVSSRPQDEIEDRCGIS